MVGELGIGPGVVQELGCLHGLHGELSIRALDGADRHVEVLRTAELEAELGLEGVSLGGDRVAGGIREAFHELGRCRALRARQGQVGLWGAVV